MLALYDVFLYARPYIWETDGLASSSLFVGRIVVAVGARFSFVVAFLLFATAVVAFAVSVSVALVVVVLLVVFRIVVCVVVVVVVMLFVFVVVFGVVGLMFL